MPTQLCTNYKMQSSKAGTSRICMYQELGLRASYTIEASFLGGDVGLFKGRHYTSIDYEDIGVQICHAIRKFSDQDLVQKTLADVDINDTGHTGLDSDDESDFSSEGGSDDEDIPEEVKPAQLERLEQPSCRESKVSTT